MAKKSAKASLEMTKAEAQAIHARLRKLARIDETLVAQYESLMLRFPKKWVAVTEAGEIFAADRRGDLIRDLEDQGIRWRDTVIEFLDPNPPIEIL